LLAYPTQGLDEVGDGLRIAYPTQRLTRRRANPLILILQGLDEVGDGLRIAYFTQRLTRRKRTPHPHPAGLG
jgi:hypothetical protein